MHVLHHELRLELNTDVVEWCPTAPHQRWLAVGTYQLDEASGQRAGRLHLYTLGPDRTLGLLSTLDLPGVFDLRWHPSPATTPAASLPLLAAALADGSVRLLAAQQQQQQQQQQPGGGSGVELAEVYSTGPLESNALAVSLDYARCQGQEGTTLAASYSDGTLQQFQATPTSLVSLLSWQGHDLEAWVAATDYWHESLIYSGGDDCAFKVWDTRQGVDSPAWANRRAHGAGVCCVASNPFQQHTVVTGSYDEKARLWDLRMASRPVHVREVSTGGGVWRLKWHPADPQLLLAACMQGGVFVLRADATSGTLAVEGEEGYPPQTAQPLWYGADWCKELGEDGTSIAATCSFYDQLLHVWSPSVKAAV